MKIKTILLIAIFFLIESYSLTFAKTNFPEGWILYPPQKEDSPTISCATYSKYEWEVSLEKEQVAINQYPTKIEKEDYVPFAITQKNTEIGLIGIRHALKLHKGWLVGFDAGEFGGALWWFNENGKKRVRLACENVIDFAKISSQIFVLAGLSHGTLDNGEILIINDNSSIPSIRDVIELESVPMKFIIESSDSILVLTSLGLYRVKHTGYVQKLKKLNYKFLYPNSMVILPSSGVIYIGMRHFVTRLTPTNMGYEEEWFAPKNCSKFETKGLDCICIPAN